MEEQRYDEKDEKDVAKHEEKGMDEKRGRDPVGTISWAAFLIWAGVVLLLSNIGQLDVLLNVIKRLNIPFSELPFDLPFVNIDAWQLFFLGAGVIVLLEVIVRLLLPAYRRSIVGSIIWAAILFGLALGNWLIVGPSALIVIGLVILLSRLTRR